MDVNVDPNNPSNAIPSIETRLPWLQHGYLYATGTVGGRTALITQLRTFNARTGNDGLATGWNGVAGYATTTHQILMVLGLANYQDLYDKAEVEGAYHYMAAAEAIHAAGFMMLADLHGEMPYTEALSAAITPKFDDGKTIFEGCLVKIDHAIELFQKTQEPNATPLKAGDSWNGGDADKWLRMCYGLKARWLNNLSKKSSLYNPDDILATLAKGPTSNANSSVVAHVDLATDNTNDPLMGDPLMTNPVYDWVGMNANSRLTKWYVNLLTNFDGKGIEDPRANSFIPWMQVGGVTKHWMRSQGVDVAHTNIRMNSGPFTVSYNNSTEAITNNGRTVPAKSWYCNTPIEERWGDTIYVSLRSGAIALGNADDQYRTADGSVQATGTFYTRPTSPTDLVTYHEMCFIKAEVLFKKGDKAGAFAAYKEGIQASIELVNKKLKEYGETAASNPNKAPMEQAAIDNFLANGIGTAADITNGKIMTQKYIALSYSTHSWNDMRRYDYSSEVYIGWAIPYEYFQDANSQKNIPLGKFYRRWTQPANEISYNSKNIQASHPRALKDDIYSFPVWWDYPTDNYKE
ncbi:hypothetical protein FACS1894177_03460 [Bacteroidia bacterium]|nr:hypothetical protein FACS1894177_03460 [Bacteroidia bacterium]